MALCLLWIKGKIEGKWFMKKQKFIWSNNDKMQNKPYDAKKSCWVPDKATGGFNEGMIENTEGEKVTVSCKGEVKWIQFLPPNAKPILYFRKKSSRKTKLVRWILPSLTVVLTCPTWHTSMMHLSFGIWELDTSMSSFTLTLASFALL